jgi:CRP/FNR family transcriptional regulator, global nitrogen regulator
VDPVDPAWGEYGEVQEQECQELLAILRSMGIASADRVYGPGDAIYNEGEYGDALYVLVSGVLKLFRPYSGSKEATLRLLKPWDIFGHLAFAGETKQRAYAEAITECKVTKVPKIFMERAIRRDPRVALKMMTLLELRLVQYEELVKCLLPRETEVRLAYSPGSRSHGGLDPRVGYEGLKRDAQPARRRGRERAHHPQRLWSFSTPQRGLTVSWSAFF